MFTALQILSWFRPQMICLVSRPNGQYGQLEENNSLPCWSRFVSGVLQQINGWYPPDIEDREIQKDAPKK